MNGGVPVKKWMLSILACTLALGTAVGCTNGDGKSKEGKSGQPANEGAAKFTISLRTLNFDYVEKSANLNEDKWVKELEKKTNVDLDIRLIPHKDYEQKMIQMFATNDIPDVVQAGASTNGKELAGSVKAGIFLPLDDLLKQYGPNLLKAIPRASWEEVSMDGKIYAIPEFLSNPSRRSTWVRADLMEKAGITKDPQTVDEYLDMLRAFKKIGVEHPFMGRENFKYADLFFGAFDVYTYLSQFEAIGGKVQPKFFDAENMQKALQVYKTMADEGLMSKEFTTLNPINFKNLIITGKAGMWEMNTQELLQWDTQLKANVPTGKIKVIPSPVGSDGKGGGYLYSPVNRSYFINKNAKDKAAAIIKFFDWMVTEEANKWFDTSLPVEPKTPEEVAEQRYLTGFLHLVKDDAFRKDILNATTEGRELLKVFETIVPKEGRGGIEFDPRPPAMVKSPEATAISDEPPSLLLTHMVKMILGKEPINDWPKVIEEWKSKGGNEILKEVQERFDKKEDVKVRGAEAEAIRK
jgi:putative aldouronate transport system substrate-binding protein